MKQTGSTSSKAVKLSVLYDALAQIRELPEDLIKEIPALMVNRQGSSNESYMRTENFIGHISPNKLYHLGWSGLIEAPEGSKNTPIPEATVPDHIVVDGTWESDIDLTIEDANILGGNGVYRLKKGVDGLTIPIAKTTAENLAFYGSQLVPVGGCVSFDAPRDLPVTVVSVGEDYVGEYLFDSKYGGGAYLEVHDRPHFHMPLDPSADGHLIIGKRDDQSGSIILSAFNVPFGCAVHMAPWTVHADSFLVGRYLVIYSVTPSFSTVIIRKQNSELAKISFK